MPERYSVEVCTKKDIRCKQVPLSKDRCPNAAKSSAVWISALRCVMVGERVQ